MGGRVVQQLKRYIINTLSQCWKQLFSPTIILNIIMETKILILIIGVLMPLLAISWRPVLVVEEAGIPGENHRPWASNW